MVARVVLLELLTYVRTRTLRAPARPNSRVAKMRHSELPATRSMGPKLCTDPVAMLLTEASNTTSTSAGLTVVRICRAVLTVPMLICPAVPVVENALGVDTGVHTWPVVAAPHPDDTAARVNVSATAGRRTNNRVGVPAST